MAQVLVLTCTIPVSHMNNTAVVYLKKMLVDTGVPPVAKQVKDPALCSGLGRC